MPTRSPPLALPRRYHLYFLFDLMPGGDLMDVLVAEAKVIKRRVPQGGWQVGCLAPKVKMLQVSREDDDAPGWGRLLL